MDGAMEMRERNNNETAINAEPLSFCVSLLSKGSCLKMCPWEEHNLPFEEPIEHNSPFYFQLPVIKRLVLWSSYNLPAHHKLNLACFLWLTKGHKFNGPQNEAFHSPCCRQYINPIGHMTASYCGWQTRPMLSEMVSSTHAQRQQ